ncbi:MAG: SsrA-binding protein [Candidatus Shikimatogenerans bostrichidophilus]|nr:MAG: SsrA-binding protein [Candidatus Shikimatogenerans bostrichidophilus]
MKNIINKKAFYDYNLIIKFNAGMVLSGKIIKLIRNNKINIIKSYCKILNNEIFIFNLYKKKIKLLLSKKEIYKIKLKLKYNNNFTIIPTKIFFSNGYAKIEIYISKKKKIYDKKKIIKKKEEIEKKNINKYYF